MVCYSSTAKCSAAGARGAKQKLRVKVRPCENMVGVNMVLREYHQNTLKQQITNILMITMFELDCIYILQSNSNMVIISIFAICLSVLVVFC